MNKFYRLLIPALISLIALLSSWWNEYNFSLILPGKGDAPSFYSNQGGHDLRLTYENAIRKSEESITLLIYSLSDHVILKALRDKAAAGVDVTIIHDPKATKQLRKQLGPRVRLIRRKPKGLMHQKVLVIDHSYVWIGSANMTRASLRHHANLCMVVYSKDLAKIMEHRLELMAHSTSLPKPGAHFIEAGHQNMELWFLPDEAGLNRLERLLKSAKKTVQVAMYTWTHPRLAQACIDAHERGVKVRCVIDGGAAVGAGSKVTEQLLAANVPTRLSRGPELLHHKFALVDGNVVTHGSANWTRSAFKRNDEVFCIIDDLDETQQKYLETVWQTCWSEAKKA